MHAETIMSNEADRAGWNENSQLFLALEYINKQGDGTAFADFLAQKRLDEEEEKPLSHYEAVTLGRNALMALLVKVNGSAVDVRLDSDDTLVKAIAVFDDTLVPVEHKAYMETLEAWTEAEDIDLPSF